MKNIDEKQNLPQIQMQKDIFKRRGGGGVMEMNIKIRFRLAKCVRLNEMKQKKKKKDNQLKK